MQCGARKLRGLRIWNGVLSEGPLKVLYAAMVWFDKLAEVFNQTLQRCNYVCTLTGAQIWASTRTYYLTETSDIHNPKNATWGHVAADL